MDNIEYCVTQVAQYDVSQGINQLIAVTSIHYNLSKMRKDWRVQLIKHIKTLSPEEKADLMFMTLELNSLDLVEEEPPQADLLTSDSLHSEFLPPSATKKRSKKGVRTSIKDPRQ
jgi:hypothetical protein